MASTLSAVSEKDSTFSNPLETIMEISSGLSQFRLDYLRVGSIAILSQNQMEKSRAILCTRHRHCNGKAFYSRSPSHPIVVLAANEFNGSSSKQKEEYCLVARITSHSNCHLRSFNSNHEETCTKPSIPILHGTLQSGIDMLRLTYGQLNKQSYVKLDHTFKVPISMLKRYVMLPGSPRSGYPRSTTRAGIIRSVRLQETSYYALMQAFELDAQPYQPEANLRNFFFPQSQQDVVQSAVLQTIKQRPNIANNRTQPRRDTQSFFGTRSAAMTQPRNRAESTPSTHYLRHEPSLIFFPALPPSPSRSPNHQLSRSSTSSITSSCSGEWSPLLPPPVTYRTPGRTSTREQIEDWCAFFLLVFLMVLAWWLIGFALWMYFNWVR